MTGHADGRIRIWHGDALVCVSGADAHGAGEPVRALAISPPASAGRTVIVTGAGYKWSGYCSYLSFPPLKFDDIPAGTLGACARAPYAPRACSRIHGLCKRVGRRRKPPHPHGCNLW